MFRKGNIAGLHGCPPASNPATSRSAIAKHVLSALHEPVYLSWQVKHGRGRALINISKPVATRTLESMFF